MISIIHEVPEPYRVRLENPYVYAIDDRDKVLNITNEDLRKIRFKGHDLLIPCAEKQSHINKNPHGINENAQR